MREISLRNMYNLPDGQEIAITHLSVDKAFAHDDCFSVVMEVKDIHLNAQNTVHGGILYTLCDQAVGAFVAYQNKKGVGMDGSIHYYRPANKGDTLTAIAKVRKSGKKVGVYFVELKNQDNKLIADGLFTTMYLT